MQSVIRENEIELQNVLVGYLRLPADIAKLTEFVDRTLNVEEGGDRFEVANPAVIVYAIVDQLGWDADATTENACGLFLTIPVRRVRDGDSLFCPYAFVSDHGLLSVLREKYGYPAWWARIETWSKGFALGIKASTNVYEGKNSEWSEKVIFELACRTRRDSKKDIRDPIRSILLMQIRQASRSELARICRIVDVGIESGKVRRRESTKGRVIAKIGGGFRSLNLTDDLGLKPEYELPSEETVLQVFDADSIRFKLPAAKSIPFVRTSRSPRFVEPRVDPRTPPPYAFEGVSALGFKVKADPDRLQMILDALLNNRKGEPRQNFRYRIATPEVVVEFLTYKKMRCTAPETEFRKFGDFSQQRELVVRLLVGNMEEDAAAATEPRVFCPLLFVDNWASMVSGREVMGLWKRMARFHCDGDGGQERVVRIIPATQEKPALQMQYYFQPRSSLDLEPVNELRGSRARGVLPWVQQDFSRSPEFRRAFAQEWLRVSGQKFVTIQRNNLPRPGEGPYRQWVETEYKIRDFAIAQPSGTLGVMFGDICDPELATLLTDRTGLEELDSSESGITRPEGAISLAKFLGLQDAQPLIVEAGSWYEAEGSFEARVMDPYA